MCIRDRQSDANYNSMNGFGGQKGKGASEEVVTQKNTLKKPLESPDKENLEHLTRTSKKEDDHRVSMPLSERGMPRHGRNWVRSSGFCEEDEEFELLNLGGSRDPRNFKSPAFSQFGSRESEQVENSEQSELERLRILLEECREKLSLAEKRLDSKQKMLEKMCIVHEQLSHSYEELQEQMAAVRAEKDERIAELEERARGLEQEAFDARSANEELIEANRQLKALVADLERARLSRSVPKMRPGTLGNWNHHNVSETIDVTSATMAMGNGVVGSSSDRHVAKFVECIRDAMIQCSGYFDKDHPPTLKQMWKWLKTLIEDFVGLKRQGELLRGVTSILGVSNTSEVLPHLSQLHNENALMGRIITKLKALCKLEWVFTLNELERQVDLILGKTFK
eukprot:TRINITY_DN10255_c0_g1_i2.p1 TRINITY_DN10255_c0_g1~~TRINITY_DN10255_c0_g1_i2.p1  ORF type:complete len:395 (+),score=88.41 TRINITY_DN10255_c0_g1_i2:66-1250(+)